MTARLRKLLGFLGSARLAFWLLAFVAVWSVLGTFVPQGDRASGDVAAWAAAHRLAASFTSAVGLHHAFSAILFRTAVVALALATSLCAWRRTKVAVRRRRELSLARSDDPAPLAGHDLEIACAPGSSEEEVLSAAAESLDRLGIRTRRRGAVLSAVSAPWTVWGSPLFHWGLVAIILAVFLGGLQRSEGLMGVAVGETKPDVPASYGVLKAGPLHGARAQRSIRVDAFDTDYRAGGIDRGPVPTVSVLDSAGRVIKTQRIYANNPLQTGSLTVHPVEFGFAATLSLMDAAGNEQGRTIQLIDISAETSSGTVPVRASRVSADSGDQLDIEVTVPMERRGGELSVPQQRAADVTVLRPDGSLVLHRLLRPGQKLALPGGGTVRLDALGFYARLSVVDDPTIPLLYGALALAMAGLATVTAVRQQLVVAGVASGDAGPFLRVKVRLWRNAPTSRDEIENELASALCRDEEEKAS